ELGPPEEARHLGPARRRGEQVRALAVVAALEVGERGRHRRQRVGLLRDPRERDPLHRHGRASRERVKMWLPPRPRRFACGGAIVCAPRIASPARAGRAEIAVTLPTQITAASARAGGDMPAIFPGHRDRASAIVRVAESIATLDRMSDDLRWKLGARVRGHDYK